MVQGYPQKNSGSSVGWCSLGSNVGIRAFFSFRGKPGKEGQSFSLCREQTPEAVQRPEGASGACICGANLEQWPAYPPKRSSLSGVIPSEPKTGGPMLSVTGINRFYYLRGFTDMRCKSLEMITQFQHLYFSDHMLATTIESGYYVPDIKKIVEAYSIRYFRLTETLLNDEELKRKIIESHNCFIEYVVEGITTVSPKLEYNQPIAKLSPQLPKEEYERWVMDENL